MLRKLIFLLAVLLSACSYEAGVVATSSETIQTACADLIGLPTSVELLEAPCTLPDGTTFFGGVQTAECPALMAWNDNGWGFVGYPLQPADTWTGCPTDESS